MGRERKDWHFEGSGSKPPVARLLDRLGASSVGEAFTVYKLGHYLTVSLPAASARRAAATAASCIEGPSMSFERPLAAATSPSTPS